MVTTVARHVSWQTIAHCSECWEYSRSTTDGHRDDNTNAKIATQNSWQFCAEIEVRFFLSFDCIDFIENEWISISGVELLEVVYKISYIHVYYGVSAMADRFSLSNNSTRNICLSVILVSSRSSHCPSNENCLYFTWKSKEKIVEKKPIIADIPLWY